MVTYPEYLTYNPCTVIINGKYTVSNIQTKGLPGEKCEAHLESISIESATVGADNANEYGAKGTVSILDYKNAVFDELRGRMSDYLTAKTEENKNSHLSTVNIRIDSYTGSKEWFGWVTDWEYAFVGTTPSLTLNWISIPPAGAVYTEKLPLNGEYTNPKDLIKELQDAFPSVNGKVPIVDASGQDITDKLAFTNGKVNLDLSSLPQSNSPLITGYNFVIKSCDIDGYSLAPGIIETDPDGSSKYVVKFSNPENNTDITEDGKITDGLVFVQNGSYPYYKVRDDGKCIIPMTSFNFNTKMANMVLQSRVLYNPNGNVVQNAMNGENNTQTPDSNPVNTQTADAQNGASGVIVTFECYNVLSFSMNNLNEQVRYEVYDEFGNKHVVTGSGTVTKASYSLQGGVVKANVTVAEYYNKPEIDSSGDSSVNSGSGATGSDGSGVGIASAVSSSAEEALLREEDSKAIPLSADRTRQSVDSDEYLSYVTEFFDRGYGELEGASRLLDWDYVGNLIQTGNIGLLTLLIAVANYGVKNVPSRFKDAAKGYSSYSNKKDFFASDIGKKPFDYLTGGLGISHWDAGNYGTIYSAIGFGPEIDNDPNFKSILTTPDKDHPGKVIDFESGAYMGQSRRFPITSGKCYWSKFDVKLKMNSTWCSWANNILHYRDPDNGMIYQSYLFKLWIEKFWYPTMKKLDARSNTTSSNHAVCLQDAVRVAREGNSATGLIDKSAGKDVSGQFDDYIGHYYQKVPHAVCQWFFCKRLASLLEQCWNGSYFDIN